MASDTLGQTLSSFNWTYVVNGITDQDSIGEYIFNAGGNQQITLIAGNNFACYDTLTYNLTLNLSPTANFSVNNACEDSNIAFNNQSLDNDGAGFAANYWDFNDGNLDSNSQVSHAYDTEGKIGRAHV